jgi:hypothetical protein
MLATARIPKTAMAQAIAVTLATNSSKEDRNNMTTHKIRNASNIRKSKLKYCRRENRNISDVNSRRETHNSRNASNSRDANNST